MKRPNYEEDETTFSADAYIVRGYNGIAFYVRGWETEPDDGLDRSGDSDD